MSERPDLNELRGKLDDIDNSILDLFEERIATCREIGNIKRENGTDVYVPAREEEKLQKVKELAGFESRPYVETLFKTLMDLSKDHQRLPAFGVLGRTLAHTYSPEIHSLFDSSYSYSVIEREPEELDALFSNGVFKGFNVTIPYKKDACARCDELDDASRTTGSVNTVVFEDGKVKGWNTDYFGFIYMLHRKGISVSGKKVLVLGTGGAASAVFYALDTLGAAEIYKCDLETEINYSNVYDKAGDAQVIVNCTPVGMFPKVDNRLLDLTKFASLEACADVVYNPSRTRFLQDAEELGLKTCGGLAMLVAQAYKSSRIFAGDIEGASALGNPDKSIPSEAEEAIEKVIRILENRMKNITIIGMPGSGKSLLARNIAKATGRTLVDLDIAFAEKFGQTPAEVLSGPGEDVFREMECEIAAEFLPQSGLVISCGGGIVTRDVNKFYVRCNSNVFYLERPLTALTDKNRPISQLHGVEKLYSQRKDKYESWCDYRFYYDRFEEKQDFYDKAIADILGALK
ncbi:MAG: chorismate mutase [Clostridiales bacterium]|nr:chorismate mutase [Clostridiales bacterium]MBQ4191411.1 chorismate mutase [Clostridiales bacterium]